MSSRTTLASTLVVGLLVGLVLALPGCQMNERMSGTAFGGGGGAILGGLLAESVGGVLLGGVGGALVGYLVGDYLADQRERRRVVPASNYPPQAQHAAPDAPRVAAVKEWDAAPKAARAAYERGRKAATAHEAQIAYEEAVRIHPRFADAHNALGLTLLVQGQRDAASAAFQRALDADPGHWAAERNLSWAQKGIR